MKKLYGVVREKRMEGHTICDCELVRESVSFDEGLSRAVLAYMQKEFDQSTYRMYELVPLQLGETQ